MIEKQLIQALEPFISDIEAIEKRIGEISLTPGPQGEAGPAGADAVAPDVEDIASAAILNKRFSEITVDAIKTIMTAKLDEEMAEVDEILK